LLSVCGGTDSVELTASAGLFRYVFTGQGAQASNKLVVKPVNNTGADITLTYRVAGITTSGCVSDSSASVSFVVKPRPAAPTFSVAPVTSICQDSTITFSFPALTTGNYQLLNGTVVNNPYTVTASTAGTTRYTFLVQTPNGCKSDTLGATIVVNPKVAVPVITGSTAVCQNSGNVTLSIASVAGVTYTWRGGTTGNTFTIPTTTVGTYKARAIAKTATCQSDSSVEFSVVVNPKPTPGTITWNGSPATSVCSGTSVTFTVAGFTPGATLAWSTGEITPTSTVTASGSVIKAKVIVTLGTGANACQDSVIYNLNVNSSPTPVVSVNSGGTVCYNTALVASVTPVVNATYTWTSTGTGTVTNNSTQWHADSSVAGTFNGTVTTTLNGCVSASAPFTYTIKPLVASPVVAVSASGAVCLNNGIFASLTPVTGATYAWTSTGNGTVTNNGSEWHADSTVAGTFNGSVIATVAGCSSVAANFTYTIKALPVASGALVASNNGVVCSGASVTLTAPVISGASNYTLIVPNGPALTGTNNTWTITPAVAGNYSYTYQDATTTCTSLPSASVAVSIFQFATADTAVGGTANTCGGLPVTLTGSNSVASYQWNKDGNPILGANSASFAATVSGVYSLTVTSAAGCVATSGNHGVVISNNPKVVLISDDSTIGVGQSTTLTANASGGTGYSYAWSTDSENSGQPVPSTSSNTWSINGNGFKSGKFFVTVTNLATGCVSAKAELAIKVNKQVYIPNLFAPTGTNIENQTFKVYGYGMKEMKLTVYNRYGVKVYETSDLDVITKTGWNGNDDSGKELPSDTYFYNIQGKYADGSEVLNSDGKNSGNVYLIK
jgi:trimeric autotransporter adhesin